MRKFAVKYFALDYFARVAGYTLNWPRAANIIFPMFCFYGLMSAKLEIFFLDSVLGVIALLPLMVALFFGFVYFDVKPWRLEDAVDNEQVFSYYSKHGEVPNEIKRYMSHYYFDRKWRLKSLLINIVAFVATLILGIVI